MWVAEFHFVIRAALGLVLYRESHLSFYYKQYKQLLSYVFLCKFSKGFWYESKTAAEGGWVYVCRTISLLMWPCFSTLPNVDEFSCRAPPLFLFKTWGETDLQRHKPSTVLNSSHEAVFHIFVLGFMLSPSWGVCYKKNKKTILIFEQSPLFHLKSQCSFDNSTLLNLRW